VFADPAFEEWQRGAVAEAWIIPQTDELYR
jgi:hypothetical protein